MWISNLEKELDFYIGFLCSIFEFFFVVLSATLPKIQGLAEFEFLASLLSEIFDDRV